jgi:hypothetical protein
MLQITSVSSIKIGFHKLILRHFYKFYNCFVIAEKLSQENALFVVFTDFKTL